MTELDSKIDSMIRKKVFSLIQENSVRLGKINIRYTKGNKKNSLEHLNALCDSHERLIRMLPREVLNLEKSARIKFQVPMAPERKTRVLSNIYTEIEVILEKMNKEYQPLFAPLKQEEALQARVEKMRVNANENIDKQVAKLTEALDKELTAGRKIPPNELTRLYNLEETTLTEMNLISPLQNMHLIFDQLKNHGAPAEVFDAVHEGISECVKMRKTIEGQAPPSHMVNERKAWKMRVAGEVVGLKEAILCLNTLAEQARLDPNLRNRDVIVKTWNRILDFAAERSDPERILAKWTPFYTYLEDN